MVRVAIDSEKPIKDSTRDKLIDILTNSKTVYEDLKKTFPKGFRVFDRSRRKIQFGDTAYFRIYIEIPGFQPETMQYDRDTAILDVREETDY